MFKNVNQEALKTIFASLVSILIGLIMGLIILLVTDPNNAFLGFQRALLGGFNRMPRSFGEMLYQATPILLTGLSVGFAFKTGLFNIGASGQFIVGGFAAIFVGVRWTFLPTSIAWIVGLIVAMIAGALWAGISGWLKAYRNVNEVITSIMLNYVAVFLVNYLVVATVFNQTRNESLSPTNAFIPRGFFDSLFPRTGVHMGYVVAVVVAIIIWIILEKTTFGFELRAVGFNRHAARYAGVNEKRNIVLSMMIAGALSGLGGALLYLSATGVHIEVVDVIPLQGFNGIPVALLASSNPLGIIFSSLLLAHLNTGGFYMQTLFPTEIINIMVSVIIYFSAFAMIMKSLLDKFLKRKGGKSA
jgi:simple sugar transport system permease protein